MKCGKEAGSIFYLPVHLYSWAGEGKVHEAFTLKEPSATYTNLHPSVDNARHLSSSTATSSKSNFDRIILEKDIEVLRPHTYV